MASSLPRVNVDYYPMGGGLDVVTPPISLDPGMCFDAQNYEPDIVAGYHRINGYERSDGRPSPTAANYWYLPASITATINTGDTVTGGTSGATGKVLTQGSGFLILGRVSGTFVAAETLTVGGVTKATTTGTANQRGASDPSSDADYKLLAANDVRGDIGTVPGEGQIRGIFVYNDVVYAFRDNVGATAGNLYKQTAGGWSQVAFGKEIQFSTATGQINDGDTITGATSGATATVVRAMLRSGTWTASGAGTLIISGVTGTFQNAELLKVGGTAKVTAASANTAIARAAGGFVRTVTYNFGGAAGTNRIYGCDGVNLAFEFDGTNYIPIRTGMTTDTPSYIACHKYHLFLTFQSSLQYSGTAAPYSWTPLTGAAEIAMGDVITGIVPQAGSSAGGALAVFTSNRTAILYGSGSTDFALQNSIYEMGYFSHSIQAVSNDTYGVTGRGLQALRTTIGYGDFNYEAISFSIQPLLAAKLSLITTSVTIRGKNQYRIYFSDGTAFALGISGPKSAAGMYGMPTRDNIAGLMPLNYGIPVRVICNAVLSTGAEVTYFGSDNGYVYQDNIGTSFDGSAIEAWIRPAFNNLKSPQYRKRFRRAVFEIRPEGYSQVNATYDIGYGNPDVLQSAAQPDISIKGGGGYWDQFTWDQFTWDAQVYPTPSLSIEGTEKNISFLFYSNRAQDESHSVTGVSLSYSVRRLDRQQGM